MEKTPFGAKIRFLRKRQNLTIPQIERLTGISHNTISRLERGQSILNVAAAGKLLAFFGSEAAEVFPAGQAPNEQFLPVSDFASWLRNFRFRKGLQQVELAEIMGMSRISICRYERNASKPQDAVLKKFKRIFKLNGELDQF